MKRTGNLTQPVRPANTDAHQRIRFVEQEAV
jgi:hypothetical protein